MTPTKLQTELLAEYMNQLCPCRLIAVTTEHKKKECPHYTFSMERDFLLSALQRQRAQALQEARDAVVGEKEYKNKTPLLEKMKSLDGTPPAVKHLRTCLS